MDTQFQEFIGKPLNDEIQEKIKKMNNCSTSRILLPDSMMTMDYRQEGFNIYMNENKFITRITIG